MNRNPSTSVRRRRGAFTLLEMMLVIALIGLLLGTIVLNFNSIFEGGSKGTAQVFIDGAAKTALSTYRFQTGSFPTSAQGLNALVTAPDGLGSRWSGPYLDKVPEDPWKRPYQYRYPGTKNPTGYDLFSFGPDGVESDDDVRNW